MKGQVQNNIHGVNVLVDIDKAPGSHYSGANRRVKVEKILTDEEIIELWEAREQNDKLELAKKWIRRQDGYATSNLKYKKINHSTIVKFKYS